MKKAPVRAWPCAATSPGGCVDLRGFGIAASLELEAHTTLWQHVQTEKDLIRLGFFPCLFFVFLPFIDRNSKALNKQLKKNPIGY